MLLAAAAVMPDLNQLTQMSARFAPVTLKYDAAGLSAGDRQALPKLVEAARVLNHLFLDQLWSGNHRQPQSNLLSDLYATSNPPPGMGKAEQGHCTQRRLGVAVPHSRIMPLPRRA